MQKASVSAVVASGFPPGLMRLAYTSGYDGQEDEALFIPPVSGSDWIVCLHGFGGRANQIFVRSDIRQAWLPVYLERGYGVFSPNLRGDSWMNTAAVFDLHELLGYLRLSYGAGRFVFSSGSMGGVGSLIYACHHPGDVSGLDLHGAVCDMSAYHGFCCGIDDPLVHAIGCSIEKAYGGTPEEIPDIYKSMSPCEYANILADIPFFLMHGAEDSVMPVSQSRRLAGLLQDSRLFTYMEIPGGGHDAPLRIERNMIPGFPGPLEWLEHFLK